MLCVLMGFLNNIISLLGVDLNSTGSTIDYMMNGTDVRKVGDEVLSALFCTNGKDKGTVLLCVLCKYMRYL